MILYLKYLHEEVSVRYPDRIHKVRFLLDGAGYHRSSETRKFVQQQGISVVLLGPYSYLVSVQEFVWAYLKTACCNPEDIQTTKK